jgi:hypothetical protein
LDKQREILGKVDMNDGGLAASSMHMLIEHIMGAVSMHRRMAAKIDPQCGVNMDTSIMAALIVCGGIVQGELIGADLVDPDDLKGDVINTMLTENWKAGVDAGIDRIARLKARGPCDDPTCKACHPKQTVHVGEPPANDK